MALAYNWLRSSRLGVGKVKSRTECSLQRREQQFAPRRLSTTPQVALQRHIHSLYYRASHGWPDLLVIGSMPIDPISSLWHPSTTFRFMVTCCGTTCKPVPWPMQVCFPEDHAINVSDDRQQGEKDESVTSGRNVGLSSLPCVRSIVRRRQPVFQLAER